MINGGSLWSGGNDAAYGQQCIFLAFSLPRGIATCTCARTLNPPYMKTFRGKPGGRRELTNNPNKSTQSLIRFAPTKRNTVDSGFLLWIHYLVLDMGASKYTVRPPEHIESRRLPFNCPQSGLLPILGCPTVFIRPSICPSVRNSVLL